MLDVYLCICSYTVQECLCNGEALTTGNGTEHYPAKSKAMPIPLWQMQEKI